MKLTAAPRGQQYHQVRYIRYKQELGEKIVLRKSIYLWSACWVRKEIHKED